LRDCPVPSDLLVCETPEQAAAYWRLHIEPHPYFNPECECFVVLFLNTRKRVKGHQLVTHGTLDTLLVHPREVFRTAIITSAASVILLHNLCAATHKLCYVELRVMCSCLLLLTRVPQRKECYA
jgi:DNA repair protein RadC